MSSKTRNPLIIKTLYRSGDIEAYGTGIPRMKELRAEVGVRIKYVKVPDGAKLIFHRNDAFASETSDKRPIASDNDPVRVLAEAFSEWSALSANERAVCVFMLEKGYVGTADVAKLLGIAQRNALRTLQRLVDRGVVEVAGANRNRQYRLAHR